MPSGEGRAESSVYYRAAEILFYRSIGDAGILQCREITHLKTYAYVADDGDGRGL